MNTKTCKIYEAENFKNLTEGLQVAACMLSDGPLTVDEASVVQKVGTLSEDPNSGNMCSSCNAGPFETRAQQIAHYKHHWHIHNLRRKLLGRPPISIVDFSNREDDGSSISGSDSESDDQTKDPREVSELFFAATRHCRAYYTNKKGQVLSIYRCLLHRKKEDWIGGDGTGARWVQACHALRQSGGWAVLMCSGGHFAGAIFRGDDGVAVKHKSLHSYVVRRGQGKTQATRDSKGNAPRSAGASLRRYNQEQFAKHIGEVLTSWKDDLEGCSLILFRAVGPLNKAVMFGTGSPISRNDTRLRTLPFPTRRPSFKEVQRAFSLLATIEVYDNVEQFQKALNPVSSTPERPSGRKPQKSSPAKPDRAKSRELATRPLPNEIPLSSEDEEPRFQKTMIPAGWTQTLSSVTANLKISDENMSNCDSASQSTDIIATLEDFDISMKKKQKNKPKKTNDENATKQENLVNKANKRNKGVSNIKIAPTVVKLWQNLKSENFRKMIDNWEGPPSLVEALNISDPSDGNTILHKATIADLCDTITFLLELGCDPTLRNHQQQTPYCATSNQDTRTVYRLFQGMHPDKYNYAKANIPGPLTPEMIEQLKEAKALQKKAKRQKEKEKLVEKTKTAKFVELNDAQKLATTENRCFYCGKSFKTPFQYEQYKFCSIKCLQNHRIARPLNLSVQ